MEALSGFLSTIFEHSSQETNVEHRSFANSDGDGRPTRLMSRDFDEISSFLRRNDKAGRGVFFGVCTRKAGCAQGRREDLAEALCVWVDIDTEALELNKNTVEEIVAGAALPPTGVVDSGRGLHAYWRLTEAVSVDIETKEGRAFGERIEAANRQLAHVFCGDPSAVDLARVMRTPDTHNTKQGRHDRVTVLSLQEFEFELDDLEEWLGMQTPLVVSTAAPATPAENPFATYGKTYGGDFKAPMDVEQALTDMTYEGGDRGIHSTQLRASMALLNKGWAEDDIVVYLLEATARAVGDAGRLWNWTREEAAVRKMISSARAKIGDKVRNIADSKATLEKDTADPHWSDRLKRDGKKEIKPTYGNLILMLQHLTVFDGAFWKNELNNRIMVRSKAFWRTAESELNDDDELTLRTHLAHEHGVEFGRETMHDGIVFHAGQDPINPLTDYLDSVAWDGQPRLDTWLSRCCGAEAIKYVSAVGRAFLVAAVARAYKPGCKVDDIMILEGEQGIGKSSGISAMAPFDDLFTDTHFDVGDAKKVGEAIEGKWFVELAELSAIRRHDQVEAIKNFASRRVDRYRPAYGRNSRDFPRTCIFFGTTNEGDYLRDITGNRRFWPVSVGRVDQPLIRSLRDQLWAEAVHAFKSGEQWWITDATVLEEAEMQRKDRQEVSSWNKIVERYITHSPAHGDRGALPMRQWEPRVADLEEIHITDMMEDVMGAQKLASASNLDMSKAKRALSGLGWSEHRVKIGGRRERVWRQDIVKKLLGDDDTPNARKNGPRKRF